MTIDSDALVLALLGAALIGAVALLVSRLGKIDAKLENHGRKLVRIETKLDIADHNEVGRRHESNEVGRRHESNEGGRRHEST